MSFQQEDFQYQDLYSEDSYLADVLKNYCSHKEINSIDSDLQRFSKRACGEILNLMWRAERNPPTLNQFDHWGKRIDDIIVDPAWEKLHEISAMEGMVALGYERKSGSNSRLHQFLKLLIFHPSSAFYTCPLAMTDGATRVLELEDGPLKKKYFDNLTSRDPLKFWTAGQWMTEKSGGSDVSGSETCAEFENGNFYLSGTKWFTSAITAQLAMTLAQTEVNGKKGLSLFLVEIKDSTGSLNNIEVLRLKDKLGTKAMPTAELRLNKTPGQLIGELGEGVKNIATVLNISRLYNSVCATGTVYRLHSLLRDYSSRRTAFGKKLIDHPLHQQMLLNTQSQTRACVHFVCDLANKLGAFELGQASELDQLMLRFFTPIAKLWTGKKSVNLCSEMVEAFGGAGYIEDTHLPRFLRDAQVFSIWEGTTNIMSLDALRAMGRGKSFPLILEHLQDRLMKIASVDGEGKLTKILDLCTLWLSSEQSNPKALERGAREFSWAIGNVYAGLLLAEFSIQSDKKRDQYTAQIFIENMSFPLFFGEELAHEYVKETLYS